MSPKTTGASQSNTLMPLTLSDGNKRKSTRAKPLNKEKENIAQRQEGLGINEDRDIILGNLLAGALNKHAEIDIKEIILIKFARLGKQIAEII